MLPSAACEKLFGCGISKTEFITLSANSRSAINTNRGPYPCPQPQVIPFSLKVFGAQSRQLLLRAVQASSQEKHTYREKEGGGGERRRERLLKVYAMFLAT